MELDADSFQEVMNAAHKPFVVIVATPPEQFPQVSENVKSIAKHYKDNKYPGDVVFTWMDSDKWGSWLKSMYGIKAENTPQVVVVKHSVCSVRVPYTAVLIRDMTATNIL